jgi:single-stranded DNA-binding protein
MNNAVLGGRICTVPKIRLIRLSDKSINVCSFVLAVVDGVYDAGDGKALENKNLDFFECISFADVATMINNNFVKGCKILLSGKFKNFCFADCNKTRHFTQVYVIDHVEFGDTESAFKKDRGNNRTVECMIEANLKDVFNAYSDVVASGFLCVDEEDYYRLAFNSGFNL